MEVTNFRKWMLAIAETVDAWRIFPRIILAGFGFLVGYMTTVFLKFDVIEKVSCDSAVMQVLLDKGYDIEKVQAIACHVTDIIGPPDSYTTLVSIIVGAGSAVFGLYAGTGRDWSKSIMPWKFGKTKQNEDN